MPSVLIDELRSIVGRRHVLIDSTAVAPFTTGYRTGSGSVAAVVRPGSLVEQWRVFKACVAAKHVVIVQAANTGLTGGSTPFGDYSRPVVIINTLRICGVRPILDAEEVVCLAGSTLYELERTLAPLGREPHSVIGSSCIGASVVGGVCNNSGGALVQRGPAYTEYALYAQVHADGEVHLRNHLGVRLGTDPESILRNLQEGRFTDDDIVETRREASAAGAYPNIVRAINEDSPARFNADPARLFEASGSAGKIMVFAVRLATFPAARRTAVFYIGTNDTHELTTLRRSFLSKLDDLPVSAEYIHREAFDVADRYGKDTIVAIRTLGTERLPALFRLKSRIDRIARVLTMLPESFAEKMLQACCRLLPDQLSARLRAFRVRFQHHLILKVADEAIEPTRNLLASLFPSSTGDVFECTPDEGDRATLLRFAVAGAAVRYRAMHSDQVGGIISLDVALRRNDVAWFERFPPEIDEQIIVKLYYGHFFCHVFHQDYVVRKGVDPVALEHRMWALLDERGARYPAEHNVGHLYPAAADLAAHYRMLDPTNQLNPGIGQTSRLAGWL
ncbi:D-lactate dehydrogenase [Sphingomonas sp. Leaf67]|uniref:D-lactate dehydrogenase n=1 Tax=Sphingomonas sp. Leaf67 TaxID=1736230 RepID=UPI000AB8D033|nr:D-lactate dehydrogenase [Sphingomonas sp. Leaf67]